MGLQQEWFLREANDAENETHHPPMSGENIFWHAVATGDVDFVRQSCKNKLFTTAEGVGILSKDPLTNMKYHFVVATAMVTRKCVESGMEMEQAFRLSDFYILKLDNAHSIQAVEALHERMVLDYTGRMRLLSKMPGTSKPVSDCIEYIYIHIQKRVTVDDLVDYTGLSASHLSRLFKKETGISISDYIREKKVEKAQELLRFCDFSLIEISNYLSFSSQSHFTQIFRAFTGMTPKKYRDIYRGGKPMDRIVSDPAGNQDITNSISERSFSRFAGM